MRCSNCFQDRTGMLPAYPNTPAVCRGCARTIDSAVGWLETHGYGIVHVASGEVLYEGKVAGSLIGPALAPQPPNGPLEPQEGLEDAELSKDTKKPRK